jgi:hypothetical protein
MLERQALKLFGGQTTEVRHGQLELQGVSVSNDALGR